ncbi:serine hydrolase domain-containing protein [Streptomyces sp. NPDC059256]|uniref:serine hydrolase domain-containing protein n=1 Tax=Streptomyces sp. NPDC059256 TaxID=3346794 RepID=UPI0036C6A11B
MTARRTTRTGVVGLIAVALAATAFTAPVQASEYKAPPNTKRHTETQRAMDDLVAAGIPGIVAGARDKHGTWRSTSGIGNLNTGAPRGVNDRFRVASITKTFVATVLLQMEAEGRLDLDDTVDRHLPGVVRGNGNDGRKITVRQLLNHTSGLFDYLGDAAYQKKYMEAPGFLKHRYDTVTPDLAVRTALSHRPEFKPGTRFSYSNTNYVLSALIIEAVGGKTYEDEVRKRIIRPLGLHGTTMPENTSHVPGPHSRAYSLLSNDPTATKVYDVTLQNASQSWADGDIISTTADLNRFYSALMRGKLLSKKQLNAMKTTVRDSDDPRTGYGLGIATFTTSCGIKLWGHSGGWLGSLSHALTTEDGSHTLAYNLNGDWGWSSYIEEGEFCGVGGPAQGTAKLDRTAPRR